MLYKITFSNKFDLFWARLLFSYLYLHFWEPSSLSCFSIFENPLLLSFSGTLRCLVFREPFLFQCLGNPIYIFISFRELFIIVYFREPNNVKFSGTTDLFCVCVMFRHNGDDVALLEVERTLVPAGELGQSLDVVVLAGTGFYDVLVQQILDLTWGKIRTVWW